MALVAANIGPLSAPIENGKPAAVVTRHAASLFGVRAKGLQSGTGWDDIPTPGGKIGCKWSVGACSRFGCGKARCKPTLARIELPREEATTMPYNTPNRFPCPFCESAADRLRHVRLAESAHAIAEMSDCERSPGSGAILIWPKEHVEQISQLSARQAVDIGHLIFRASAAVLNALGANGFHTFCSAGTLVGQSEAHMHFQVQPRYSNRPYSFAPARELPIVRLADRHAMSRRLSAHLSDLPQDLTVHRHVAFGSERMFDCHEESARYPDTLVSETSHFTVMCHPRSRTRGALIVLSKRRAQCFLVLTREEREELMLIIRDLSRTVERALRPDGLSVWWDSGADANQAGADFVAEIVPRFEHISYTHQHRRDLPIRLDHELVDHASLYRSLLASKAVPHIESELA